MQAIIARGASILIFATALTACLATTDLLREPGRLSSDHLKATQEAVYHASQRCVTGHYTETSGRDTFAGGVKITQRIEVRDVSISDSGWYKLYIMTKGVFDHIYYNPSEQKIVCGDKSWQANQTLASLKFDNLTAQAKNKPPISLETRPSSSMAKPAAYPVMENIDSQKLSQSNSTKKPKPDNSTKGQYLQIFSDDLPVVEIKLRSHNECTLKSNSAAFQSSTQAENSSYICAPSSLGKRLPYQGKMKQVMTGREYVIRLHSRDACLLLQSANKDASTQYECP